MDKSCKRKVAILGCGFLGQFLAEQITDEPSLELVCVWGRDAKRFSDVLRKVPGVHVTDCMEEVKKRRPDLVVEVAHPDVTHTYGVELIEMCDYMIGSPSALADDELFQKLVGHTQHSLYVPSGAFWGGEDIRKMADLGNLEGLKVSMNFHPESLKLKGELKEMNEGVMERTVLYQGPVRGICSQAPNNANSMAAACIAGHTLGFDGVQGCLVSDPGLKDAHVVEVEVWGKKNLSSGKQLHVRTTRRNPAQHGNVTGAATLASFYASLLRAHGKEPGVHLC